MVAQSVGEEGGGVRSKYFQLKSQCRQNIEGFLVEGGGAGIPSSDSKWDRVYSKKKISKVHLETTRMQFTENTTCSNLLITVNHQARA